MIVIDAHHRIDDAEIEWSAIRAQGKGGQNVNKVSSAVHLRFDIRASSLPEACKARLLAMADRRITDQGVVVIKAQSARTQEQNRLEAIARLCELIRAALVVQKRRRATRPTQASKKRRVEGKKRRGALKRQRRSLED